MQTLRTGTVGLGLVLSVGCSNENARLRAEAAPHAPTLARGGDTTTAVKADTARSGSLAIGVWRGTSTCTKRPSPCNDEIAVYRITRGNGTDSLSVDARKMVNGQEDPMGVLPCYVVSGSQFTCSMPNGTWHFTIRGDSLIGDLRLPDHTQYRDIRTARSR